MKSTSKKQIQFFAVSLFFFSMMAFSSQLFAQTKHAGKPWPAPDEFVKMKNPVGTSEAIIADGKELYTQHCKPCHGVKGKGDGEKAAKIEILSGDFTSAQFMKETDGEIYWKTTEGRKPMPAYNEKLNDTERWTIVSYVRSLSKK